ncbi:MAG: hypothetical protein LBH06_03175 [Rikenellaceae bacterium]|jgi:hypothetical protein|nr:hypothetical protein [Rikenellaceae bacterium]
MNTIVENLDRLREMVRGGLTSELERDVALDLLKKIYAGIRFGTVAAAIKPLEPVIPAATVKPVEPLAETTPPEMKPSAVEATNASTAEPAVTTIPKAAAHREKLSTTAALFERMMDAGGGKPATAPEVPVGPETAVTSEAPAPTAPEHAAVSTSKTTEAPVPTAPEPAVATTEATETTETPAPKLSPAPEPAMEPEQDDDMADTLGIFGGLLEVKCGPGDPETPETSEVPETPAPETHKIPEAKMPEPRVEPKPEPRVGSRPVSPFAGGGRVVGEVVGGVAQRFGEHVPAGGATLRNIIGVNDRFLLLRDLFYGDTDLYDRTVEHLDAMAGLDDALIYLGENFTWNPDGDGVKLLLELLSRRFNG